MTEMFARKIPLSGFTLVELLIVIAIMGLLGTVSVSSFYALRKGMEQRSVVQTVDEFVRAAYRRAMIDRVPTAVYFWNETISDENEDRGGKLVVVGHAVAVRQSGRISRIEGKYLIDEFGDLESDAYRDEDGNEDASAVTADDDPGRYLYQIGKTDFHRSIVSSSTVRHDLTEQVLMTQRDTAQKPKIKAYAYYLREEDGVKWEVGSAYGLEFAELTLPQHFIFGTGEKYSKTVQDPEEPVQVIVYHPSGNIEGGNVSVSGEKLSKTGEVSYEKIGTSADPKKDR